jgi:hypothetical protein
VLEYIEEQAVSNVVALSLLFGRSTVIGCED